MYVRNTEAKWEGIFKNTSYSIVLQCDKSKEMRFPAEGQPGSQYQIKMLIILPSSYLVIFS